MGLTLTNMNTDEFITKIRDLIARPYEPYQPSIESEITKLLAELDHPTKAIKPSTPKTATKDEIDPTEAPDGYRAIKEIKACDGCAFETQSPTFCVPIRCMKSERNDQQGVIFKRL